MEEGGPVPRSRRCTNTQTDSNAISNPHAFADRYRDKDCHTHTHPYADENLHTHPNTDSRHPHVFHRYSITYLTSR